MSSNKRTADKSISKPGANKRRKLAQQPQPSLINAETILKDLLLSDEDECIISCIVEYMDSNKVSKIRKVVLKRKIDTDYVPNKKSRKN